jgi:hypothetical protein
MELANWAYGQRFFLQEAKKDAIDFLTGRFTPFPDFVAQDELYRKLTSPSASDKITFTVLQLVFGAW